MGENEEREFVELIVECLRILGAPANMWSTVGCWPVQKSPYHEMNNRWIIEYLRIWSEKEKQKDNNPR